jgi:hypothetical protein
MLRSRLHIWKSCYLLFPVNVDVPEQLLPPTQLQLLDPDIDEPEIVAVIVAVVVPPSSG